MTRIIGLSGPKGVGKSTVARALRGALDGDVWILSFASPIKDMLDVLSRHAGVDQKAWINPDFKEYPWHEMQNASYRKLAQTLGTEWGRQMIGVNLWTDIAMAKIDRGPIGLTWIIDDVRMLSEQDAIERRGGLVVRLSRPGIDYTHEHETERPLKCRVVENHLEPEKTAEKVLALL